MRTSEALGDNEAPTDQGGIVNRWPRRRRFVELDGWLLVFASMVFAAQFALFLALFAGVLPLATYAAIHILACLGLAAGVALRVRIHGVNDRNSAALQIVAWSAFAGPFGAFVGSAVVFQTASISPRTATHGDAADHAAESDAVEPAEHMHSALLDRRVRLDGASSIRPLADVIAEGSRPEKLEAVRIIYRKYEVGLSAVLKSALRDSDTSVRVLAATVIAKLHGTYTRNIGDLQVEAAANPKAAETWRALADARLVYAKSGLLESPRARTLIESAIEDLSNAAELQPSDQTAATLLDQAYRQLAACTR